MKTFSQVTILLTTFHCGCSFATPVSSGKSHKLLNGYDAVPPRTGSFSSTQDLLHDQYFHNVLMEVPSAYSSAKHSNERATTSSLPTSLPMKQEVGTLDGIDNSEVVHKDLRLIHAPQSKIQKANYEETSSGNHHRNQIRSKLTPRRPSNKREERTEFIQESPLSLTLVDMVHNHSKQVNNYHHIQSSQSSNLPSQASWNLDQKNDLEYSRTQLHLALHKQLEKDFITKEEHQRIIEQSRKVGWNGERPNSFEVNLNRLAWKKSTLFHLLTKGTEVDYKSHIAEHYVPRGYHEDYIKLLNNNKDLLPANNEDKAMSKKPKFAEEVSNLATTRMYQLSNPSNKDQDSDHLTPSRTSSRSVVSTDLTLGRPSE